MNANHRNRKWLVLGALALVGVVLIWSTLRRPALQVESAIIVRGPLRITVDGQTADVPFTIK